LPPSGLMFPFLNKFPSPYSPPYLLPTEGQFSRDPPICHTSNTVGGKQFTLNEQENKFPSLKPLFFPSDESCFDGFAVVAIRLAVDDVVDVAIEGAVTTAAVDVLDVDEFLTDVGDKVVRTYIWDAGC
jgi:hypothetical protein